jgi:hypothetical protein
MADPNAVLEELWGRIRIQDQALTKVPMSSIWKPYSADVYPASDVITDAWQDSQAAIDAMGPYGLKAVLWNSPLINSDGVVWVPNDPANPAAGARNNPTTRLIGAVLDFEFLYNGDTLSFMLGVFDQTDCQVYVSDDNDVMHRLKSRPMIYTGASGVKFRTIKFATRRTRRIRFVMAADGFYQFIIPANAIVQKSKRRDLVVSVSDSFREASGSKNAGSAESYHTLAVNDFYIERTGCSLARLGQGGTGYFNNATGVATNAAGPLGARPFFSDENVAKIKAFGKNKIRWIDVNGTINDGSISGGKAGMKARAHEGFNKISSWDSGIRFVLWGPEPYNNSAAPNTDNDINRQALMEVAAERSDVLGFIDVGNPANPFYYGTGSEKSPQIQSSQSVLTGYDEIHPNYMGCQNYATLGLNVMANFMIERERPMVA